MGPEGIPEDAAFSSNIEPVNPKPITETNKTETPALEGYISYCYPSTTSAIQKRQETHAFSLFAATSVFIVAIVILAIAMTCIAPGVPQSIVIAMALSGVSLGGFSIMKQLAYTVRNAIAPQQTPQQRAKSAMKIGAGFAILGGILKVGGNFVTSGPGSVLTNLGGPSLSTGIQSGLNNFVYYLYMRFFSSSNVREGQPLSEAEMITEANKLHVISMSLVVVGAGFVILGMILAIVGTVILGGVPAVISLVLAPPCISIGIGMVLQNLLHNSVAKWKKFLEVEQSQELFVDTSLSQIESESVSVREVEGAVKFVREQEITNPVIPNRYEKIPFKDIKRRSSLTTRQKVIYALATLLLIAGIAAMVASGFGGLVGLHAFLVSTVGGALIGCALPIVVSGLVYNAFQLKLYYRVQKARSLEKKKENQHKHLMANAIALSDEEIQESWLRYGENTIIQTENKVRAELDKFERYQAVYKSVLAGFFVVAGTGIMLLALVPGLAPIAGGVISIGSTIFSIGLGQYLQNLVVWMREQYTKLRMKYRKYSIVIDS